MNKITLSNIKGYTLPTHVYFSDITINVGMNSVGKSTLVQSILLVRQAFDEMKKYRETAKKEFHISLNGPYDLQLGDSNQITSDSTAKILVEVDNVPFAFAKDNDIFSLSFTKEGGLSALPECALFAPDFYYINAERLGPRNYQDIGSRREGQLCGYHGEYTFEVIERHRAKVIPEERRRPGEAYSVSILSKQIEYWMDYIVPGIEFQTDEDVSSRTAKLKIRQTTLDTDFSSPHNFGFGISYLLPIIVTGLLAESGSVFIVENPEAHLHPSGQSRIGRFLAQMALAGVIIILETHSEHVVNGIRLCARQNQISPERVCINYFSILDQVPCVERIPMNEYMDILKWPKGFFDQEELDLMELRHLRRKQ